MDAVLPRTDENSIINSALWAAAGDALGWITELARDGTVEARAGVDYVEEPIEWRRFIGGRTGVRVHLPAGTYSDDTQLRLAVGRSIRGNGTFDPETFGRVELPVWQSYALGAGNGTKAAASNLARKGVNWFSNFFDKGSNYIQAGGNGAAMRIQPHVWAGPVDKLNKIMVDVMRDAVITHGHPHGFVGAAFHAIMLHKAVSGTLAPFHTWHEVIDQLGEIPRWLKDDRQIAAFWIPAWEQLSQKSIRDGVFDALDELHRDVEVVAELLSEPQANSYELVLQRTGCLNPRYRGSGLKTAFAASCLALLFEGRTAAAMIEAANMRESDTDTIATMAGSILGAIDPVPPTWPIQDVEYIRGEARRYFALRSGKVVDAFAYPDLVGWQPPATQSDAVGLHGEALAMVGLGLLAPLSEEYFNGEAIWQWFELPFGQSILAKRRAKLRTQVPFEALPGSARAAQLRTVAEALPTQLPLLDQEEVPRGTIGRSAPKREPSPKRSAQSMVGGSELDDWTDEAIRSGFDDRVLGRLLNLAIDTYGSIEGAATFAGIVAKAKLARRRRGG